LSPHIRVTAYADTPTATQSAHHADAGFEKYRNIRVGARYACVASGLASNASQEALFSRASKFLRGVNPFAPPWQLFVFDD